MTKGATKREDACPGGGVYCKVKRQGWRSEKGGVLGCVRSVVVVGTFKTAAATRFRTLALWNALALHAN